MSRTEVRPVCEAEERDPPSAGEARCPAADARFLGREPSELRRNRLPAKDAPAALALTTGRPRDSRRTLHPVDPACVADSPRALKRSRAQLDCHQISSAPRAGEAAQQAPSNR